MFLYCIVNVVFKNSLVDKKWKNIEQHLKKISNRIIVKFIKNKNDGTILAKEAVNLNVDAIVCAGGDGTINEVVNGMVDSKIPLAIIPFGTGNDLCRSLNIPPDPLETVINLAKGRMTSIDLGKVNNHYFANIASVGIDAEIASWVNNNRWAKSPIIYDLGMVYKLILNKNYHLNIKIDDKEITKDCTLVAVANGNYYGKGQKIAPKAKINDGFFDIVIISSMSRLEIIKNVSLLKEGKHIDNPKVSIYKAKNIIIESENIISGQYDGEELKTNKYNFMMTDKSLNIFVP